jgi:FkbH-like protein
MTEINKDSAKADLLSALDSGDGIAAVAAARCLLGPTPKLHQLTFVRKSLEKLPADAPGLFPLRVALLSSFSIEFVQDSLLALGFVDGLRVQPYQAGFGQFRQEILDPSSGLYREKPDVVVLAIEGKDLVPLLYRNDLGADAARVEQSVSAAAAELASLIRLFRERSSATLLIHNFVAPRTRALGVLDGQLSRGTTELVNELNQSLYATARSLPGVYVVDYARLVQRHGAVNWYDLRMEHYAKLPIAQAMLPALTREYLKYLRALAGKTKKCVVLDLDNTLWGGVVGEEGVDGIQLGANYPGSAFVAFQEALLGLQRRGIILTVASKNNPADVDEVFARHPSVVLKKDNFAHMQVHWRPKSESIVAIARELNLGLEHLVFVDDNPTECEEVGRALPMVSVLRLPERPEEYVEALLESGYFDALSVSMEDQRRSELYKQRDQAEQLRAESGSMEDFYRSLELEATIASVDAATLARAAQLTQKTNQFNATTLRYTESQVSERVNDPNWAVVTISVRDRFGDNGIVGLVMAQLIDGELDIDTFLLSCRVIGRTVETALLAHLCEQAERRGARALRGRIIPTAKNGPVRELYQSHGFERVDDQTWRLALEPGGIATPPWFRIEDRTAPGERVVAQLGSQWNHG